MMFYEHDDGIRSTTRRARVVKVDDSKSQQRVDLRGLKNEKPKNIWRQINFGFSSVPPQDSDGVMIQMGSRSDRSLYLDGGHEKYRPKNTPSGCSALFNMFGDIFRMFKNSADVVHQKKVNIRIGHGYNAGDSGEGQGSPTANGQPDDASGKDAREISIVLDGDSVVVTCDDSSVKWESGKITLSAPHVVIKSDRVDLGAEGGVRVKRCDDSCATKVYAV